ncbi:unnamed protein product [Brachionus calyciflorus]|uniref:Uncharacterized protein n=1 Tax=Brachionus calyciflorus TaxID=104777 RepID=A0A813YN59_9BILA|nr:unnamed protein product [Brachionus calyciflorus]
MKIELKRIDLFELATNSSEAKVFVANCEDFIKKKYNISMETDLGAEIPEKIRIFHVHFRKKFAEKKYMKDRFLNQESDWLNNYVLNDELNDLDQWENCVEKKLPQNSLAGRPLLPYEKMSSRSQRRVGLNLAKHNSNSKLLRGLLSSSKKEHDYQTIRNLTKAHGANIFPPYSKVLAAKKECYPANSNINETTAQQPLQDLLDHTAKRLLEIDCVKESINGLIDPNECDQTMDGDLSISLVLKGKWGFDGATGQSIYKQNFSSNDSSDKCLFSVMFVPLDLRISCKPTSLWKNATLSSTRFCRPIKINFDKETTELIRTERDNIESQIKLLTPLVVQSLCHDLFSFQIHIKYELFITMLDEKAVNAVTNNQSPRTCNFCLAMPKQMNKKQEIKSLKLNQDALMHGLSALHCYIHCFEAILHISYRFSIKRWDIRGEKAREMCEAKKKKVQESFWTEMDLLVDFPKDCGSEITEVDEQLIFRLHNILCVVNSSHKINLEKFKIYCDETYDLYVEKYDWYYMPVTMHRLLVHSAQIIDKFELPIGFYTEEALESSNKINKLVRLFHTRKMNRKVTLTDQFNRLLVMSDIFISTLSISFNRSKKKNFEFSKEASKLIILESAQKDKGMISLTERALNEGENYQLGEMNKMDVDINNNEIDKNEENESEESSDSEKETDEENLTLEEIRNLIKNQKPIQDILD